MEEDFTVHSKTMDRDFDVEVYGTGGAPIIVLPEGNGSCSSWNDNGMVETLSDHIDDGTIQLFCVDSADPSGWYFAEGMPRYRKKAALSYIKFLCQEFVPFVRSKNQGLPILAGAGIGALNASIAMLQHPELFGGLLAMSGTYDARNIVGEGFDDVWEQLSPVDIAEHLTAAQKKSLAPRHLAFVTGQNESEDGADTQRALEAIFKDQGIEATFEYWGEDVTHTWMWWQEMARQMVPCLLSKDGLEERKRTGILSRAQIAASQAADVFEARQQDLAGAEAWLDNASANVDATSKRLDAEEANVAVRTERARELQESANALWSARDAAAQALAEAEAVARAAQDEADKAAHALADAQWIEGEAQAAAASAVEEERRAKKSVATQKDVLERARYAKTRAEAALKAASAQKKE
jgi:esterase/lipase superfamily enzyme